MVEVWINVWPVYSLCDGVTCPVGVHCSSVAVLPHLGYYLGDYNGIVANRNDVQNYENKTQVVTNQNYPRTRRSKTPSALQYSKLAFIQNTSPLMADRST